MNGREAKEVLGILLAAFPGSRLEEPSVVVYARALERWPLDIGMLAASDVIAHFDRFPTLSQLAKACGSASRRVGAEHKPKELEEPSETYKERGRRGLAAAREALEQARLAAREPRSDDESTEPPADEPPATEAI